MLYQYASVPQVSVLVISKNYSCLSKRLKTVTLLFKE